MPFKNTLAGLVAALFLYGTGDDTLCTQAKPRMHDTPEPQNRD